MNSLKTYDTLTAANLPEPQARAIVQVISSALETNNLQQTKSLATKVDTGKFDGVMSSMESTIKQMEVGIRADMAKLNAETKVEMIRWMFVFWIGQVAATIAVIFSAIKLLR